MSGVRSQVIGSSARRRWASACAAAALAVGLAVAGATPSQAAPKASTSLSFSSITPATGSVVIAGDKADLKGTASANLVGKRLTVQVRNGTAWESYPGSGTVSAKKGFSIRIRATGNGTQTFRVRYAGSASLKPASATRSVKVWTWTRMVELPVASTTGSSTEDAAAHAQTDLVVGGVARKSLLAGTVPAGGTGAATFDLEKHCQAFRTTVGITDSSPAAGSITFSVYLDDVSEVVKKPGLGTTATIALRLTKVSQITLRNTEPHPAGLFDDPVIAAWPDAQVLCDVLF